MKALMDLGKDLAEILGQDVDGPSESDYGEAKHLADLSERELKKGFALLHAQAVVSLWAILESVVRALAIGAVTNVWLSRDHPPLRNLRVRVLEFEALTGEDRSAYLVDLVEREMGVPLRQGCSRFDSLLEAVGIVGSTGEEVAKTIFEFGHVRNVLVHNHGDADRRFVESCPWLGVKVGERIAVNHERFMDYFHAAVQYVHDVTERIRGASSARQVNQPPDDVEQG